MMRRGASTACDAMRGARNGTAGGLSGGLSCGRRRAAATMAQAALLWAVVWSSTWAGQAMAGAPSPEDLPLRPPHDPPSPAWWPPAPGWWLIAGAVLLVLAALAWWRWRRRRHRLRCEGLFHAQLAAARTPAAEVAAMSELLRRAARRSQPEAVAYAGEAWLKVVEGGRRGPHFDEDQRRLLLEGGFRRDVAAAEAAALRAPVLRRYLQLMGAGR